VEADAFETEDAIKKELGDKKIQVAPIWACCGEPRPVCGFDMQLRPWLCGAHWDGAVMGSKNLKAIALRGTQTVSMPGKKNWRASRRRSWPSAKEADFTKANRELGQAMAVVPREENGLLR